MSLSIKQIGNGGAFNYEQTNSSFLINVDDDLILFDCGYSVFNKLRKLDKKNEINLSKLKYIYITHLDDDHIGSLKTLIYYQYFMNGITMNLIFDKSLYKDINNYVKLNDYNFKTIKVNYEFIKPDQLLLKYIKINKIYKFNKNLTLKTFKGEHHKDCFGLIFTYKNKSFAITGDTIATKNIEENCKDCLFVYHDFSFWNEPDKQVHACKDNINNTYSKDFIKKLKYYHTGKKFNSKWENIIQ